MRCSKHIVKLERINRKPYNSLMMELVAEDSKKADALSIYGFEYKILEVKK